MTGIVSTALIVGGLAGYLFATSHRSLRGKPALTPANSFDEIGLVWVRVTIGQGGRPVVDAPDNAWRDIWGYSTEEIGVKHFWTMVHPQDRRTLRAAILASMTSQATWCHHWRITTPDGLTKTLWGVGRHKLGVSGEHTWCGLLLDASSASKTLENANPDTGPYMTADAKLEDLATGLSHDFGNLLETVAGNIDLIDPASVTSEFRPLLVDAHQATKRMKDLNRRLGLIGCNRQGDPREMLVGPILTSLSEELRRTFPANVVTHIDHGAEPYCIVADPNLFEVAVRNLAQNARDAMPLGGRLRIEVARSVCRGNVKDRFGTPIPEGDYIAVTVSDTGRGMSSDILRRAFHPYVTTRYRGEGSGLGLAMVEAIVSGAGGAISITSAPARGTSVVLYFPELRDATS
ncbi:MAG: ATP-binding protein [Pseudomonadota bacterium]